MKVRYTETALAEIAEILAYISERNATAAAAVVARVEHLIRDLSQAPKMAQQTDAPGVRRPPLGRYPYVIFYTIEAEEVVILHVRHGARRLPWDEEN
jgi:addiction module RelE/StbE family toxin